MFLAFSLLITQLLAVAPPPLQHQTDTQQEAYLRDLIQDSHCRRVCRLKYGVHNHVAAIAPRLCSLQINSNTQFINVLMYVLIA